MTSKKIAERNLIYLSDTPTVSLKVLEFLYKTQNLQNITLYLNAPNEKVEQNLLDMQSYLLNKKCSININNCNGKNKELFKASFQSLLNSYTGQKMIIVVDAQSQKMFHTHFTYKDLLKGFDVLMMIYSKPKNLIGTFSSRHLKWIETSLNLKELYFDPLEKALRNSQLETTPERFEHTIRVVKTSGEVMSSLPELKEGMKIRVLIACAYHDFAKNWKLEKLQSSFIKKHPELKDCPSWALHGPVAAFYLKTRGLVKNASILKAIECHTQPPKKLGIVGKIVIISDKLEPLKENNFPNKKFQELGAQLKKGNYENVYEYLRLNPKIRKS